MIYFSTRDKKRENPVSLKDAALMGLAPDGGLFVPEYIPKINFNKVEFLSRKGFREVAKYAAEEFFGDDISSEDLAVVINGAFDFKLNLKEVGKDLNTLELFHGPTFAFKDFGARFMGKMLPVIVGKNDKITILTATSGDTGSAVAEGFFGTNGIKVVILYPDGKVSPLQESQMTTLGGNIRALRIDGNFDDCQRLAKEAFSDRPFRQKVNLTSANSIDILRWIPQSFYYLYATALCKSEYGISEPEIVVPSGNYGNLTAGMLAAETGMPVKRFIAASNANDVIPQFLESGKYDPRSSVATVANAMDVGTPSNYERMMWLANDNVKWLQSHISGYSASDIMIKKAIREIYKSYNYLSDPHSAVGYLAAKHYQIKGYWLSTAHHAKFGDVIWDATGVNIELPEKLRHKMLMSRKSDRISLSLKELEEYIMKS